MQDHLYVRVCMCVCTCMNTYFVFMHELFNGHQARLGEMTSTVRETSASRCARGPMKDPLLTPQYDDAMMVWGSKEDLKFVPHDAERR